MINVICASFLLCSCATAQMTTKEALPLYDGCDDKEYNTPFKPTTHPGAQWFKDAGFGLFINWGIYSVAGLSPSWSMIDNCFGAKKPAAMPWKEYYKLADEFNPKTDAPDEWLRIGKEMGMQYAVFDAKHHDGYCLWPTEYGKYSTKIGANGRDLVAEYVKACRKYGLKVGFYFSPRDWSYNNHRSMFKGPDRGFDHLAEPDYPWPVQPRNHPDNVAAYRKFLEYTKGQLAELLTRYGKIDVLWFDGVGWAGINLPKEDIKLRNWIYKLQPHIVINPRWGGKTSDPNYAQSKGHHSMGAVSAQIGDFYTIENNAKYIEDKVEAFYADIWVEFNCFWKGHWGYKPAESPKPNIYSLRLRVFQLTFCRAFGCNYLINFGPDGDGNLRPDLVAEAEILAKWMVNARPALIETQPVKTWETVAGFPLTKRDKTVYVHLPQYAKKDVGIYTEPPIRIKGVDKPTSALELQTQKAVAFEYDEASRTVTISDVPADPLTLGSIVALEFSKAQVFPKPIRMSGNSFRQ